jgi:hypothetical protein
MKKDILLLLLSWKAIETKLQWMLEKKKQTSLRKSWDNLPVFGWETAKRGGTALTLSYRKG